MKQSFILTLTIFTTSAFSCPRAVDRKMQFQLKKIAIINAAFIKANKTADEELLARARGVRDRSFRSDPSLVYLTKLMFGKKDELRDMLQPLPIQGTAEVDKGLYSTLYFDADGVVSEGDTFSGEEYGVCQWRPLFGKYRTDLYEITIAYPKKIEDNFVVRNFDTISEILNYMASAYKLIHLSKAMFR